MTDREMLELAAKASGLFLTPEQFAKECTSPWLPHMSPFYDDGKCTMIGFRTWYGGDGSIGGWEEFEWNPLSDDSDALRLAVKLKIDVKHYDDYVVGWFYGGFIGTGRIPYEGNPLAATRLAITRAAAETGKAMP